MNDWQRTFLQKLETAKKQWLHRFEQFAVDFVEPVFAGLDEFATSSGFHVSSPDCEPGTRIYKFALTENGYLLIMFRMQGLEGVEVCCESSVPGAAAKVSTQQVNLGDATENWVEQRFQSGLDRFVTSFAEAGADAKNADEALVRS